MITGEQQRELSEYLGKALGDPCEITRCSRISMGQSRGMYALDLECDAAGERKLVLRVEQHGLLGTDSRDEVKVMRALHRGGYPVAEVVVYEPSDALLGQPFFAMEFVEGTSVFVRESLDPYVEKLAELHALDYAALGIDFLPVPVGPRDSALFQVERFYQIYREGLVGEPSPLVEEAAQWLRNRAPETQSPALVHGDTGPGNYLHQGGELRAIVDWEFAHIGDPEEDWAFLITMRGAGIMDRERWVAYLAETVGVSLEPDRLDYWVALNQFKGACIDQTALGIFMRRKSLAPNLLAIGTWVHLSAVKNLSAMIRSVG